MQIPCVTAMVASTDSILLQRRFRQTRFGIGVDVKPGLYLLSPLLPMTKAIKTLSRLMQLVERGRKQLDEPVARHLRAAVPRWTFQPCLLDSRRG
jgi:CubicO group peptidase (beta-lactamase class C family)